MTDHEAAVRAALDQLAAAMLAQLRAELADTQARPPRLLSIEEAAEACSISRAKMYLLIQAGKIESRTVGRRRLVSEAALRAFIENSDPG